MLCPTDGATLVMSERSGIEIDYCPTCRGVWLDRGELDKIIERSAATGVAAAPSAPAPSAAPQPAYQQPAQPGYPQPGYAQPGYDTTGRGHYDSDHHGFSAIRPGYQAGYGKKPKNWLSELFD
ncbi:MAG TPA: zf-TFIIB domain-containing protein [Candidatus Lumbricidophila sp.]|nr:zf-TFIIB domain-containing protein [Candidatus Lumbricidophila sp.]